MKNIVLSLALVWLLAGSARGDVILGTSNPPGTPLAVIAGTTSGPMSVNVASNNTPNDVMVAWQFALLIVPDAGATGTLTFQNPATGTAPNPTNYIFSSSLFGIAATNGGSTLTANDFDGDFGTVVPSSPANLLGVDFLASPNASGVFGIYALQGAANTVWTDDTFNTVFFANVPDGTGRVRIGEVLVQSATPVPEPSTTVMLILFILTLWPLMGRGHSGRSGVAGLAQAGLSPSTSPECDY